jgi:periplasmic protein CpxP/Spy
LTFCVVGICVFSLQASAQNGAQKAAQKGPQKAAQKVQLDSMMTELQLDTKQKDQIKAIKAKYKPEVVNARQNKDHATMKTQIKAMQQEIRQVLTEQQKQKWDAFVQGKRDQKAAKKGGPKKG